MTILKRGKGWLVRGGEGYFINLIEQKKIIHYLHQTASTLRNWITGKQSSGVIILFMGAGMDEWKNWQIFICF